MRSGWIAFFVSLAIHGAGLAAFCLLPGGRIERTDASFVQDGSGTQLEVATWIGDQTEVIELPSAPPVRARVKPEPAPVQETNPAPGPSASSPAAVTKPANTNSTGPAAPSEGSAMRGLPGGVATTFFAVPATGQRIVYLIDGSASMGLHGAFAAARAELLRSVALLPETVSFQIIVFNRLATPLLAHRQDWMQASSQLIVTVEQALRNLRAEGATDPRGALRYALSRQPAVLFFLTDAGEFQPDIAREITLLNKGRSIIHVIELGTGPATVNDSALRTLATGNSGTFKMVPLRPQTLSYQSP
jgi:hypothetical protein